MAAMHCSVRRQSVSMMSGANIQVVINLTIPAAVKLFKVAQAKQSLGALAADSATPTLVQYNVVTAGNTLPFNWNSWYGLANFYCRVLVLWQQVYIITRSPLRLLKISARLKSFCILDQEQHGYGFHSSICKYRLQKS